MKSRYKNLIVNSLIFAVGNLGSKLISFLLVPIYTYTLSRNQFGTVDVLITTVSVFIPIVSLSIFDAVFRFAMDVSDDRVSSLSNGMLVTFISGIVMICSFPLLNFFKIPFLSYFLLILFLDVFFSVLQNFVRAVGYVKIFSISGIINAVILGGSNILFLVVLHLGVKGYIFSIIVSLICSILFISMSSHIWTFFSITSLSYLKVKEMLKYSIPLIPNSLSWWFTNDASRFFILFFVGTAGNGLFAVSNKIPTILSVFFTIFAQAWQMSAVKEFDKKDAAEFYSKVFNLLISSSFVLVGMFILFVKPFMRLYVSPGFFSSWEYVPVLLLAATFSNFSAFLGTTYLAAKKTSGIFLTTIVGMIINVGSCLLLIPIIGVHGAGIGGAIGFFTVSLLRYFNTKKFLEISIDWPVSSSTLLVILAMIFTSLMGFKFSDVINSFFMLIIFFINRRSLLSAFKFFSKILLRKLRSFQKI